MENTIPAAAASGSFSSMVQAFEILGLTHLLGEAGEYSAFTTGDADTITYHIIPGRFSSDEILDLVNVLVVPPILDRESPPELLEERELVFAS